MPPTKSQLLVLLQFTCLAALAFTTHGSGRFWAVIFIWSGLALGGIAIFQMLQKSKLSVMPEPRQGATLVKTGIYKYLRHPMYSAVLLASLGMAMANPLWWRWLLWLVLIIVIVVKIKLEESYLLANHPDYAGYCSSTKRIVPLVW